MTISSSPPRNHTPLVAIVIDLGSSVSEIHLFYTTSHGFLAATLYVVGDVIEGNPTPMNSSFAVASDSRALSITLVPRSQNGTAAEAILLYEGPYGNITILRGCFSPISTSIQWIWYNISGTIYSSFHEAGTWLSPPITAECDCFGPSFDNISLTNYISFTFFNPNALSNRTASPLYTISWQNWNGLGEFHIPKHAHREYPQTKNLSLTITHDSPRSR